MVWYRNKYVPYPFPFFRFIHRFVRRVMLLFCKATIYISTKRALSQICPILFFYVENGKKYNRTDPHDMVSYVTSFVVFALIFTILPWCLLLPGNNTVL